MKKQTLVLSGLLLTNSALAGQSISAEVLVGNATTEVDVKMSTTLPAKLGLFTRNKVGIGYDNTLSNFGLVDATYNIGSGDLVLEGQYVLGKNKMFSPRAGIQGYTSLGNFSLYGLSTLELTKDLKSPALLELVGTVSYVHKLPEGQISSGIELLADVGTEGLSYLSEALRIGYGTEKLEVGLGTNLAQIPSPEGITYGMNSGIYIKGSLKK